MPVIEDLKGKRNAAGLTQFDLAHAAGTSIRTIQRLESGRGAILAIVRAVLKALKGGR